MTGADRVAWQYQLAAAAGITRPQLSAYERGREQPSVATLTTLLRALGCSVEEYGRHLGPWGSAGLKVRLTVG